MESPVFGLTALATVAGLSASCAAGSCQRRTTQNTTLELKVVGRFEGTFLARHAGDHGFHCNLQVFCIGYLTTPLIYHPLYRREFDRSGSSLAVKMGPQADSAFSPKG